MQVPENELKGFILDSGLVSRAIVEDADRRAKERGQSIGDLLVSEGLLSGDALRRIISYVLGVPFVPLQGVRIPFDILSLIPEPIARAHNIVAFSRNGNDVEVALLDTEDLPSIDSVRQKAGVRILPRLTDEASIKAALLQYQKFLKEEFGTLIAQEAEKLSGRAEATGGELTPGERKRMAEDLPVVRIVDTLLRHAILQGASDVHMEVSDTELLVRYRIDGILHDAMALPKTVAKSITARIKILASLSLEEDQVPQDGRFKMETENEKVSFRVSVLPTYFGEKVVLRVLRGSGEGFTLEALGFHGKSLESVHAALRKSSGLILVSGPAGSGTTTTLYTMLDLLNSPSVSIATIEDPVEYQMKRVNQSQVNPAIGFTYANGLRSLLRQDPNIIMIGEIRDSETAMLAINAALTGHLVLSSITSSSPAEAIHRLIDLGVDPALLMATVHLITGQRLVRKLCERSAPEALSREARAKIANEDSFAAALAALAEEKLVPADTRIDTLPFYAPRATPECPDGYKGYVGLHEVLAVSPAIKSLVARGAASEDVEKQARKEGMLSLREDGICKAARGTTSLEEVARVTPE